MRTAQPTCTETTVRRRRGKDARRCQHRGTRAVRVLIVYTIGFAAFAIRPAIGTDASQPLTTEELLDKFANGLRWLLAGIVHERVLIRGSPSS